MFPLFDYLGPKTDYDLAMEPKALALTEWLKTQPNWKWWRRFVGRTETHEQAGERMKDVHGYSPWLGWTSFTARNPFDPVTKELEREFARVYGRCPTICDIG